MTLVPAVSELEIKKMRHALGVQLRGRKWTAPYRNHFVAAGDDVAIWGALVEKGYAQLSRKPSELTGGNPCYSVTAAGRAISLIGISFKAEPSSEQLNKSYLERVYPLPPPEDDKRFTFGLVIDVAAVLHDHGYPKLNPGLDYVELQQALFRFLYADKP